MTDFARRTTEAFTRLLKELDADQPKRLVHYTSLAGLKGMVESASVWSSDPTYLNDSQEIRYLEEPLTHAFKQVDQQIKNFTFPEPDRAQMARTFANAVRDNDFGHATSETVNASVKALPEPKPIYVSCFCDGDRRDADDRLSQWRGYGGSDGPAYSISFDTDALRSLECRQDRGQQFSRPILRKVIYDVDRQVAILARYINEYLDALIDRPQPVGAGAMKAIAFSFQAGLQFPAACFKHPGFAEEDEWRLILNGTTNPPKFRASRIGLIPFKEIENSRTPASFGNGTLQSQTPSLPIARLRQGPTAEPDLAARSMAQFLSIHGYNTELKLSRVPFRA